MSITNTIPHYQTCFCVADDDKNAFLRLKANVYGWLLSKEKDRRLRSDKCDFFYRGEWPNLFETRSNLRTDSFMGPEGGAWSVRHTHADALLNKKRFWYTDVGLTEQKDYVIVSVRVSYAWNVECLSIEREEPSPSVPKVLRYILQGNHAYSGRREFKLIEKPIPFDRVGLGKPLTTFIQAEERRYPLIVVNGDDIGSKTEAAKLAYDLTGKCQVAILSTSDDIQDEFNHYMPEEYRVAPGFLRVYFPFGHHNNPSRHRWSRLGAEDYSNQREGIVHGLLRHHALIERGAVESIQDIDRLISREKLRKLVKSDGAGNSEMEEFYALFAEIERERDNAKIEAQTWAAEVDAKQSEINSKDEKLRSLERRIEELDSDKITLKQQVPSLPIGEMMPKLPDSLRDALDSARLFFTRLDITPDAFKSASDYSICKSIHQAWEILAGLNNQLHDMKFNKAEPDLESAFQKATGYQLAMCESSETQKDRELMKLRNIHHNGRTYQIIPHVKYGSSIPKVLRVHFAFDDDRELIVVGYVGPHLSTAGTRRQS